MRSAPPRRLRLQPLEDRLTPAPAGTVPEFGTDGLVTLPVPAGTVFSKATTDPATGDVILAGGLAAPANGDGMADLYVLRLTADGRPVASFGTQGVVTLPFAVPNAALGGSVTPQAVVSGPNGITLALGVSGFVGGTNARLDEVFARLTPAGQPDPGYDGDGLLTAASYQQSVSALQSLVPAVALSAGGVGAVVAPGQTTRTTVGSQVQFAYSYTVTRVDGAGSKSVATVPAVGAAFSAQSSALPLSTNSVGAVAVADSGALTFGSNVSLLSTGGTPSNLYQAAVIRLAPGGFAPDAGFGTGGAKVVSTTGGAFGPDNVTVVGVQSGGQVVAVTGSNAVRLTATGTADGGFGTGGLLAVNTFQNSVLTDDRLRLGNSLYSADGRLIAGPAGSLTTSVTVPNATTTLVDSTIGPDRFAVLTTPPNSLLGTPGMIQLARAVGPTLPLPPPPNTAPTVSDIADQSGPAGPLAFTVGDAQTDPAALAVTASTSNTDLFPAGSIAVGGAGANRTLTLTPAAGRGGTATITVTVTDAGGLTASDTFTVTVPPPVVNTPPTIAGPADQTVAAGGTVGPLAFTVGDAQTPADQLAVTVQSSNSPLVPAGNVVLSGNGASRMLTLTPAAGQSGTADITLTVSDGALTASATFRVTVQPASRTPARLVGVPPFAAASGNSVTLFNPDRSVRTTVTPFPGFAGSVRSASADLDGDGTPDILAGTGPGATSRVSVIDGDSGEELLGIDPFETAFTGGVYVAAGDIDADGKADLIVTPDEGGGPRVDIYSGATGAKMASFFGIDDPDFRGGARAATGDMNADGVADLIISAGFGGGPRIAVFDGKALARGERVKLLNDFFAFETGLRNGAFVAAGDLDGDGFADPIFGGGPGGGPRVLALSGRELLNGNITPLANFFAGDTANRGGIRVSVKNLDADERADLVVGAGTGAGGRVTAYLGKALTAGDTSAAFDLDAGGSNGVFVG